MSLRSYILTAWLGWLRDIANQMGCELIIEASDHSLETTFEHADKNSRAWDPNLYRRGQLYIKGYANPVKPAVDYNQDLEDPDTAVIREGDVELDEDDEQEGAHTELISSPRYREYMRQDLISQLLNPREQWRLIMYAVIGLGGLMLINVLITLSVAGAF